MTDEAQKQEAEITVTEAKPVIKVMDIHSLIVELQLETRDIKLPELSGVIRIRQLSGKECDEARAALLKDGRQPTPAAAMEYKKLLLKYSLVDNEGKNYLDDDSLANKFMAKLSDHNHGRIQEEIENLNFVRPDHLEEEKKN